MFVRKMSIPTVPVILGILLGQLMEKNLRRALNISDGDLSILYQSPLAFSLLALAVIGFVLPIFVGRFVRPKHTLEKAYDDGGTADRTAPVIGRERIKK